MEIDIDVYVNNERVKRYSGCDKKHIICPRVGEYVLLRYDDIVNIEAAQIENSFDENGYLEVHVTKVVHDLQYGYIDVYTITEKKHR